ncbi:hypothetical protein HIM_06604 [Hirsutella minnesotensis 3608]|uniref:Uncharacterized protein n=1 Tax=Hirsutella minnesotensis 3608 TaxID=1043627 RepID=A0A0F7ZIR6_9HYPO|nr:hypothetical protein HIM_06604 [Hirsutella minnesotensis 3608]
MDLMTKPGLTKRDDLYKRAVVADVLNGINDVIKTHKLDMSGALRGGVDALRNASMTVNYNEVVPLGFTVAIDQNTQIQQIPFGNMVGGMVKSLVGSFDWNGFVNRDVFNFASGAVSTLDANAVVAGAINTFVTAIQ